MATLVGTTGPHEWAALACMATLALLSHAWREQVTRTASGAVTVVGVDAEGEWWLVTRGGGARTVRIASVCAQRCAVVATAVDDAGGRYALVLAADSLSGEQFRSLSVRLRMLALDSGNETQRP